MPIYNSKTDRRDEAEAQKQEEESRKLDASLCHEAFEVCMKGFVPRLGAARSVDDTFLSLFRHCNTSWRHGVAAVRQDLIDVSKQWDELGLPDACPYTPSAEELAEHKEQYEDFESVFRLKSGLMRMLDTDSDGWVPAEEWDRVKAVHDRLFAEWLEAARDAGDPTMPEEKARKLWPFDHD